MPSGRGSLSTVSALRIGVTAALVGLLAAGCGGSSSTAPTIDASNISVLNETLVPVGQACHVRGTVVNMTTDTTLDVGLGYQAFDAGDTALALTHIVVRGLAPSSSADFESTGFASNDRGLVACSAITRFERTETSIVRH
jgi:hypothetical protein